MTLTKEWLLKTIAQLEEERDATPGAVNEDATMALAAMKRALASLEAEPYGYLRENDGQIQMSIGPERPNNRSGGYATPWAAIYLSPPALMLPEEMPKGLAGQIISLLAHNISDKFLAQKIWNACRAAMLQDKADKTYITNNGDAS